MDGDPWYWTVSQVTQFFRDGAASLCSDKGDFRLPEPDRFERALVDNHISGADLLTSVESSTLKEYLAVPFLGQQNSVLYCIKKLRRKSLRYRQHVSKEDSEPPQMPEHRPVVQSQLIQSPPASVSAPETAVRQHEVEIEDRHGRKRRRLDLSQLRPTSPAPALQVEKSFLGRSKLTVDELFYGPTALGQEVTETSLHAATISENEDPEGLIRDFQLIPHPMPVGTSQSVESKLRRSFRLEDDFEFERNGRLAVAKYPYRESSLYGGARSATVYQFKEGAEGVAVTRENAAYLALQSYQEAGPQMADLSEEAAKDSSWDYLVHKWKAREDSPGISMGEHSDSSTDSDESEEAEGDRPDAEDEAEEEHDDALDPSGISKLIDDTISGFATDWKAQLPQLEEKKAWTVWKQIKQSTSLRRAFIANAEATIQSLGTRLKNMKQHLMEDQWSSERALLDLCEAMRPSVEDREMWKWKIDVWNRNESPQHTTRLRKGKAGGSTSQVAPSAARLELPPDDRFTVSSAQPTDHSASADSNELGLLQASPKATADDGLVDLTLLSDNDSLDGTEIDRNHDNAEIGTPQSPLTLADPVVQAHETAELPSVHLRRGYGAGQEMGPSSLLTDADSRQRATADREPIRSESPPVFKKLRGRPKKASVSKSNQSTPKKNDVPSVRIKADYSANPLEATADDVAAWKMAELVSRNDTIRILIKSLAELRPEDRAALLEYISKRRAAHATIVDALHSDPEEAESVPPDYKVFMQLRRLAAGWMALGDVEGGMPRLLEKGKEMNQQLLDFLQVLRHALARPKIFSAAKPPSSARTDDPIVLSSDTDVADRGPNRRRKRVQQSKATEDTQAKALERQERFNAIREALDQAASSPPGSQAAQTEAEADDSDVVVNPARGEEDAPVYVPPNIAVHMKKHQIDGVQFMWREVTAGGQEDDDPSQGCILAHTMGLGKTMQTITLLACLANAASSPRDAVRRQLPKRLQIKIKKHGRKQLRILIMCPPSLVQNWKREIEQWAGKLSQDLWIIEGGGQKQERENIKNLETWHRRGGIVLIGYQKLLQSLKAGIQAQEDRSATKALVDLSSVDTRGKFKVGSQKHEGRAATKTLVDLESVQTYENYLLQTPEIVVADEAHYLKNRKAGISEVASRFKTGTRIALTGTPMSNDVPEIYALVSWVAPGYLGEPAEFSGHFTKPIKDGSYEDSSASEVRRSMVKLAVLRKKIEPKVNRADITVLRGSLKPKVEFVITLPLLEHQRILYCKFIESVLSGNAAGEGISQVTMFSWLAVLTLLMNHPLAFKQKLLSRFDNASQGARLDMLTALRRDPEAEQENETFSANGGSGTATPSTVSEPSEDRGLSTLTSEAQIQELVAAIGDDFSPLLSAKMTLLLEILALSRACGDQVLVFTSSIPTLDYLEEMLRTTPFTCGRIDGRVKMQDRMTLLEDFRTGMLDVMLISTKAGGVGLNMQNANRVVLLDFGFNPTHEAQAVGRAYRLGQPKPVFVYRLVTGGTFETNIYDKQIFKSSLSSRVVDRKNPVRNVRRETKDWLYLPESVDQDDLSAEMGKDPSVLSRIIHDQGHAGKLIRSLKTMETLQEEAKDAPLTEEERRAVNEEIAAIEKMGRGARSHNNVFTPPLARQPLQPSLSSAASLSAIASQPIRRPEQYNSSPRMPSTAPPRRPQMHTAMPGGAPLFHGLPVSPRQNPEQRQNLYSPADSSMTYNTPSYFASNALQEPNSSAP